MRLVALLFAVLLQQGARGVAPQRNAAERLEYLGRVGDEYFEGDVFHELRLFWSEELPNAIRDGGDIAAQVSDACIIGYEKVANATDDLDLPLLVDMVDAWGKPGAGLFEGNTFAYGAFDQCLAVDGLMEYCIGTVTNSIIPIPLQLAMCVPKGCTTEDLAVVINDTLILQTNAATMFCTSKQKQPYNAGAIIMLIISALFVVMVIVATACDLSLKYTEDSRKKDIQVLDNEKVISDQTPILPSNKKERPKAFLLVTAFSLYETVPVVLSTKQPSAAVTSINGLRVISMFWVILGHTHVWLLAEGADNLKYLFSTVVRRFSYQPILNGYFSVDTFFFLSGLLVAYLTLRDMSRRKPGFKRFPILMYYIHRILRLTPAYAFVLFGYWFLSPHLGNGPIYNVATGVESAGYKNCVNFWWTNLLYINNLYPWKLDSECMGWTWYLANDMQFYILAPLMIIPLFVHFAFGLAIVAIFLAVSFSTTASLVGVFNFQASQFAGVFYNYTEGDNTYSDLLYIKPYHRIMCYLVGIILGYLIYRKVSLSLGRVANLVAYLSLWIVAVVTGLACVYGLYAVVDKNPASVTPWLVTNYIPSKVENVFYITLSRFAWGVALALLVFCCHNGYGGWVNKFLSWGFWVPLSRLTFMAYLVHPIVLNSVHGSMRAPLHYNDITIAVHAIGNTVLAFGAAFVLAVFVEFPLGNLEMAVFKLLGVSRRESARHGTEAQAEEREGTDSKPPFKPANYAATKSGTTAL